MAEGPEVALCHCARCHALIEVLPSFFSKSAAHATPRSGTVTVHGATDLESWKYFAEYTQFCRELQYSPLELFPICGLCFVHYENQVKQHCELLKAVADQYEQMSSQIPFRIIELGVEAALQAESRIPSIPHDEERKKLQLPANGKETRERRQYDGFFGVIPIVCFSAFQIESSGLFIAINGARIGFSKLSDEALEETNAALLFLAQIIKTLCGILQLDVVVRVGLSAFVDDESGKFHEAKLAFVKRKVVPEKCQIGLANLFRRVDYMLKSKIACKAGALPAFSISIENRTIAGSSYAIENKKGMLRWSTAMRHLAINIKVLQVRLSTASADFAARIAT